MIRYNPLQTQEIFGNVRKTSDTTIFNMPSKAEVESLLKRAIEKCKDCASDLAH